MAGAGRTGRLPPAADPGPGRKAPHTTPARKITGEL